MKQSFRIWANHFCDTIIRRPNKVPRKDYVFLQTHLKICPIGNFWAKMATLLKWWPQAFYFVKSLNGNINIKIKLNFRYNQKLYRG